MRKSIFALAIVAATLFGCATIVTKEMEAAQVLITSEAKSAENVICRMLPIGTWMSMYGSSPARADGWSKICNIPSLAPPTPPTVVNPFPASSTVTPTVAPTVINTTTASQPATGVSP